MTIDQDVQKLLEECPILLDEDFQNKHPGIVGVAAFMNESAKTHYRLNGKYEPFDNVGVNNIRDYLDLIQQGNQEAIRVYQKLQSLFRFS